ncbi:hypothetical protein ACXZ8Z_01625 [Streptococcus agalactiae]
MSASCVRWSSWCVVVVVRGECVVACVVSSSVSRWSWCVALRESSWW